jgi:hypothetical protein
MSSTEPASTPGAGSEPLTSINSLQCIDCHLYAGHTEGRCSQCYRRKFHSSEETIQLEERELWRRTPMTDEELDYWYETGIRERTKNNQQCVVCFHDSQPLISNFVCECPPATCSSCNLQLQKCPLCNIAGKYHRVTKEEIKSLLTNQFNEKSRMDIYRNAVRNYPTKFFLPFKFEQLLSSVKDIDAVVLELYGEGNAGAYCEHMNTIYCLAIDYWKLTLKDAGFVLCYKGYDGRYVTSYVEITKWRKNMDRYGLMTTVIGEA